MKELLLGLELKRKKKYKNIKVSPVTDKDNR